MPVDPEAVCPRLRRLTPMAPIRPPQSRFPSVRIISFAVVRIAAREPTVRSEVNMQFGDSIRRESIASGRRKRRWLRRQWLHAAGTLAGIASGFVTAPWHYAVATDRPANAVRGRFVFEGTPPERKRLTVDKDVDCCGKFDIRDESLMVSPQGGVANVYVYVRSRDVPVAVETAEKAAGQVVLDNRDCIFKPHCLALWSLRQELHIVNSDPIAQNVAFSPLGDLPANIVLAPAPGENTEASWRFRRGQTQPFVVLCNYHPWEKAYLLVRDNPYFALSGEDGGFEIIGLPPGEWEFQLWHERVNYLNLPDWPQGRRILSVRGEDVDLGTIRLRPGDLGLDG